MKRKREIGETVWLIAVERRSKVEVACGVISFVSDEQGYRITLNDDQQVNRFEVWGTKRGALHRLATSEVKNATMDRDEARREARKWERKAVGAEKRLKRSRDKREALAAYAEVPR